MDELEEALKLDVRKKIYGTIKRNPGLHFRELQRRVEIATGALQYHLDFLQKKHLVKTERETKFLRYYLVRQDFVETDLMGLLRQESIRRIAVFLMQRRFANNTTIAHEVGLSPSTTSWHLEKLAENNVIEKQRKGRKTYYKIVDKEKVAELLVKYRRSFLDDVVNNFVEVWEEI